MDTIKIPKAAAKMIAHRGLSGIEPENTCAAFCRGRETGAITASKPTFM